MLIGSFFARSSSVTAIILLFTVVFLCSVPQLSAAACCKWSDGHEACASCPSGYTSGCSIPPDSPKCNCFCDKDPSNLAAKLAAGDKRLQSYFVDNFEKIITETQRRGFHMTPGGVTIAITPPVK